MLLRLLNQFHKLQKQSQSGKPDRDERVPREYVPAITPAQMAQQEIAFDAARPSGNCTCRREPKATPTSTGLEAMQNQRKQSQTKREENRDSRPPVKNSKRDTAAPVTKRTQLARQSELKKSDVNTGTNARPEGCDWSEQEPADNRKPHRPAAMSAEENETDDRTASSVRVRFIGSMSMSIHGAETGHSVEGWERCCGQRTRCRRDTTARGRRSNGEQTKMPNGLQWRVVDCRRREETKRPRTGRARVRGRTLPTSQDEPTR